MADWAVDVLTFAQHMQRARAEYPGNWPATDAECVPELGLDGQGSFNMLQRAGYDRDLRKNDVFMYFGDDGGLPTAAEFALFDHVVGAEGEQIGVVDEDEDEDDQHGPDDPTAMAPLQGVELCALLVKAVVSFPVPGGTCTWVLGNAFSMARYLRRSYSLRCARIAEVLLDDMHPREHMLTDLWQAARIHNVVAVGTMRTLCEWEAVIPPPVGVPDDVPFWWRPGYVRHLDCVLNAVSKQALEFRPDHRIRICACSSVGCERRGYDRGEDVMARCALCERWFHARCVAQALDGVTFNALDVQWMNGGVSGPATRRVPNGGEPVWRDALRGLRVRVDPPVRSWERLAAGVSDARYWVTPQDHDGAEFRNAWREAVLGGDAPGSLPAISEDQADRAMQEVEAGTAEIAGAFPLICPFCDAPM